MRIPISVAVGVGLVWLIAYLFISKGGAPLGYSTGLVFIATAVSVIVLLLFSDEGKEVEKGG